MDKEKQIEEMAHIMGSRCMNTCPEMTCPKCGATSLYDAGYGNLAELKAENERIRQNSVSHETFKAIMYGIYKEIAVLNRALEMACQNSYDIDCMCYLPCDKRCNTCKIENVGKCMAENCIILAQKELAKEQDNA